MTGALVGTWEKVTRSPCSAVYPDELELRSNGRYVGRKHEGAREHPIWDIGTYEVVDEGLVAISTANDAVRRYAFSLAGEVLTFEDRDGCRFQYRRET